MVLTSYYLVTHPLPHRSFQGEDDTHTHTHTQGEQLMAPFGGKSFADAVSGIGGNGVGRLLAAVAAAMLVRIFSGPGIALLPENDAEDDFSDTEGAGDEDGDDSSSSPGKVRPVTIRWRNITCSLSDKSSKSVRESNLLPLSIS